MRLKELFTNRIFLKNIGLAVALAIVLIWITMLMLSFYTNKGESFPTPDLKNLSVKQLEDKASRNNFRFIIQDSIFKKNTTPGTVVAQNPAAGHKIKPNRLIAITIASFAPEQVEVPKLTDVSMRQAKELLESKGFALGNILLRSSEFDDLVLEQKYNGQQLVAGSKLANGSSIDLVVGRKMGGGESTVPDVVSLTLNLAESILKSSSLSVGSAIYDPTVVTQADTLNAIIWKQLPQHDSLTRVMPGTSVDLWLKPRPTTTDSTAIKIPVH
ncbi:MAG: PASTA domain-containing protein [Bacteroidia bacterium]|nr:PASTA domain-containing protein [Bacteroidia bacterium]